MTLLSQTIEALLRYIFSTIEEESMETVKEIVKKSLSDKKGESVMGTIAERFINEGIEQGVRQGIQQGMQQGLQQGMQQGLQLTLEGIEMVLDLKFGEHGLKYMGKIRQITDVEKLKEVMNMIKRMRSADELKRIIN